MSRGKKRTAAVGRPSPYKDEYVHQAFALALLGVTDAQMAGVFQVSEVTINAWKKAHPDFLQSLKDGRAGADSKVAESLYKRACGYDQAKEKVVVVDKVAVPVAFTEHMPPDPISCIFWLKNRQPALWREKRDPDTVVNNTTNVVTIPADVLQRAKEIAIAGK